MKNSAERPDIRLLEDEQVDDLQYRGLKIIQKKEGFRFGIDAVLLANFTVPSVKRNDSVVDLGTGSGIVAILIAGKSEAGVVKGLEIQPEIAEMASRSVRMNNLEDKVEIMQGDIRKAVEYYGPSSFDVVVTNPPYISKGAGLVNPLDSKAVARHELMCTLEDVIKVSSKLLKPGGLFAMVHRPHRLVDIVCYMRCYGIEPKYLRFVHPSPGKKANLLLIRGMRGGKPELKMMEPLYVYDQNGCYTQEINEIYAREVNVIE